MISISVGMSEIILFLYLIIIAGIWLLILIWVYRDAVKRYPYGSMKPLLWLLVVFFTHFVGLILYILLRPEKIEEKSK